MASSDLERDQGPLFVPSFGVPPLPLSARHMFPDKFVVRKDILVGTVANEGDSEMDDIMEDIRLRNTTSFGMDAVQERIVALFQAVGLRVNSEVSVEFTDIKGIP